MIDLFREISHTMDSKYGIATVNPNRKIRKCKIYYLRIEYFLSKGAVVVGAPISCGAYKVYECCMHNFGQQIIEKSHKEFLGI